MVPKATLRDWFLITRPWSVTAPLVPFLVGLGLVVGMGVEAGGILRWALGLVSGILLVLACNLFNTWGDERSGVDAMPGAFLTTPQVQEGKFTLRQVFVYGSVLFLIAGLVGVPTLFYPDADGGWRFNLPLLVAAAIGFAGAVNYSTGIKYKYLGLGVPAVAFLEGFLYVFVVSSLLVPAMVTDLCAEVLTTGNPRLLLALGVFLVISFPVASLVGVILHGNDMRDIATDHKARVRSLASMIGTRNSLCVFFALHLLPYAVPALISLLLAASGAGALRVALAMLPFLVLPLTIRLLRIALRDWRTSPESPSWIDLEKGSGSIHFLFGLLYSISLLAF